MTYRDVPATQIRDTESLAYILERPDLFFQTGYKVLRNQQANGFVRCTHVLHNGKDKLVYDIADYQSLQHLLSGIQHNRLRVLLQGLLQRIREVRGNGFLRCENIVMTVDQIFVDGNTNQVFLIYLPVDGAVEENDASAFEDDVKRLVVYTITQSAIAAEPAFAGLVRALEDPACTLETCAALLAGAAQPKGARPAVDAGAPLPSPPSGPAGAGQDAGGAAMPREPVGPNAGPAPDTHGEGLFARFFRKNPAPSAPLPAAAASGPGGGLSPALTLQGWYEGTPISLAVTSAAFTIGKKPDEVDGVIEQSTVVSRRHCRVVFEKGTYSIEDIGSTNGTFLNGRRLAAGERPELHDGDHVRIANVDLVAKLQRR